MTFQELPLRESLIKAITERGYVEPTDIQMQAIPALATTDTDFVGRAQQVQVKLLLSFFHF